MTGLTPLEKVMWAVDKLFSAVLRYATVHVKMGMLHTHWLTALCVLLGDVDFVLLDCCFNSQHLAYLGSSNHACYRSTIS